MQKEGKKDSQEEISKSTEQKGDLSKKEEIVLEKKVEKEKTKNKHLSKKVKFLILFCLFLMLIIGFFIFSKFRINVSDELTIKMTPLQKSIVAQNSETIQLEFKVRNENFAQCSAICDLTFIDLSSNKTIATSRDEMKHKATVTKSFDITMPRTGEGQVLYEFSAVCNNQKSLICITSEDKRYASSFVAVKYVLSEEDAETKTEYKQKLEELNSQIINTKTSLEQLKEINLQVSSKISEFENAPNTIESAGKEIAKIDQTNQQLILLWSKEEYNTIKQTYKEEDLTRITELKSEIDLLIDASSKISKNRGLTSDIFNSLDVNKLLEAEEFLSQNKNDNNNRILQNLNSYVESLLEIKNIINQDITHSEENTTNKTLELEQNIRYSLSEYQMSIEEITIINNYLKALLEEKNASMNTSKSTCELLTEQISRANLENGDSLSLADSFSSNMTKKEKEDFDINVELAKRYLYTKTGTNTFLNTTEYNDTSIEPFVKFATIDIEKFVEKENEFCVNVSVSSSDNTGIKRLKTENITIKLIEINLKNSTNIIKEALKESNPVCCIDGECNVCCKDWYCNQENFNRSSKYPIIFVHGHSFNDGNSPEASIALFDNLQNKLEEEGYLSMGQIDLNTQNSDETKGMWAGFSKIPTMKASYYYITYYTVAGYDVSVENQEGIENYAIRLREIIDKAKEQTGSEKVVIIAHSMGGLVSREYIYLFGESSVDKIITLNTPHQGVSGRTQELCTLFGAKKECEDLSEGSILISRLSSRPISKNLDIYALRTVGCVMDDTRIGDGVVTNESGILPGAVNIEFKGNCTDSLQTDLHNNAVDPAKYPEVYAKIVEILKN